MIGREEIERVIGQPLEVGDEIRVFRDSGGIWLQAVTRGEEPLFRGSELLYRPTSRLGRSECEMQLSTVMEHDLR